MFEFELKDGAAVLHTTYLDLSVSSDPKKGYKPVELFISSIVGCSGSILQKVLEKKRVDVKSLQTVVKVERNEEEANRITKIELHFIISSDQISEEQMKKVLEVTMKNCGMIQSVKELIKIIETFEILK